MSPHGDPLLDVVMLVHDQAAWTDLAIRALEHHTRHPYRLTLVDQASREPATHAVLEGARARGHRVIVLPENRSFSNGVNAGVGLGAARHIVLLNSDALVTEGWDGALLQDLADRQVGLVGARSNAASGAQGDPAFIGEPPWLVFVCAALRREVWDAVGPMDEVTFDGFSSEDLDYSWRVVKAGYRLKVSAAYVLHAGSRTLAAEVGDAAARAANDRKYNARLVDKWGREWVDAHAKLRPMVLLATYHAEQWTRVRFMGAFAGLKRSDGVSFQYYHHTRSPIHAARTLVCDYAADNGFDVLVQLDDDATFPPDLVRRLLGHGKDLVCALAYQRQPPHGTCAYQVGDDGLLGAALEDIERTGLRRVDVSGLHVSALRTSAIRALRAAGIRQYFGGFENRMGEDFAFCLNLKKVGIPVHVDTDLIAGHLGDCLEVDEAYRRAWRAQQQAARATP